MSNVQRLVAAVREGQERERAANASTTIREALVNLLDVFERCEAGFPPDIELRFLARDLAKAALKDRQ